MKEKTQKIDLNEAEKEIILLKAVWEIISSSVNKGVFCLYHKDQESTLMFNSTYEKKYFGIMLVELLSKPSSFFGYTKDYTGELQQICDAPNFNQSSSVQDLKIAVTQFVNWLNTEVSFDNEYKEEGLWCPSVDSHIRPKISRKDFLYIYGNTSKHKFTRLDDVTKKIISTCKKDNNEQLSRTEALLVIEDIYGHLNEDIFIYYASNIAEYMNNIIWGIYKYLLPEFNNSIRYKDDTAYEYIYPSSLTNKYAKEIYWQLMNCIRARPRMPLFTVMATFKKYY